MKNAVFKSDRVKKEVNNFVNLLQREQIKITQVILFGSFAKGKPKNYSDIDLAVVSPDFGKDTHKEMVLLAHLSGKMKYHPLIGEIKKYGKVVYES